MVHVGIPYAMFAGDSLSMFLEKRLNPEISFDSEALDSLNHKNLEGMAGILKERGLTVTVHAPFMDIAPGSPDQLVRGVVRKRLQQVIDVVKILKPRTVVCHAAYEDRRYRHMKDKWLEYSFSVWRWFGSRVADEGGRLVLENVFENSPEELLDLFKALAREQVGFCLDVGHQAAFSSVSLERWLQVLGEFLHQLHLHDNNGIRDEHLAIGKGTVDFPLLFRWLEKNRNKRPVMTIEPHTREDIDPSIATLERFWPW